MRRLTDYRCTYHDCDGNETRDGQEFKSRAQALADARAAIDGETALVIVERNVRTVTDDRATCIRVESEIIAEIE